MICISVGIISAKQTINSGVPNVVFSFYRYGNGNTYSRPEDSDAAKANDQYLGEDMSSENLAKHHKKPSPF